MGLLALRRYVPYLRPYVGLVVVFGLAQLGALAVASSIPKVIEYIIDGPVTHHQLTQLVQMAGLLVLIGLLEFVFVYLRRNYSGAVSLHMETDLRNDFYAHLQSLQVSFHDNWQSGQLLSRAVSDIATVRRFVSFGLIWFLQTIVTFAVVFVLMLELDWKLAIVVTIFMLPIAYFSNKFHDKYKPIARRLQDQQGDLTTIIEEMATGVRIIKAFGRMPLMQKRFEDQAGLLRTTSLEGIKARALLWTQINFLPNLSLVAVLLLGGYNVVQGTLTIGGLIALMNYVFMLTWPMDAIGYILSMSEECQTASQRLNEVLDSRPEIADHPGARALDRCRGHIELRGVGFKYPKSNEWILRDLNLTIEPGETVGIVGRTGSGKTTLAYLLPRLYDVDEGAVLLDGVDVRELQLRSLRSHIGVAFEDPILFSASVHENLVMGRPIVSDEELKRALEVARAGFVWDLPWGLETRVGEQGYTLSGGQRQRLALARAVLGGPPILVLDDPLSSVDVHTEAVIEESLARVLEGVTGLLVVHRPSTLALADRVALLDGGRIAAQGTHTELMKSNDLYRALLSQEYERSEEGVPA
ncbi:MAG TPA: ABC transporter ATP-binding protein [Candidatus Acidoferrum sp.]|nr:ABC transporter ATP-binding protein [Candidatus Angelobacter sp.]HXD82590.1 ABC transporter ATP-binding protein [Candidatus Acidoferrum sp.]